MKQHNEKFLRRVIWESDKSRFPVMIVGCVMSIIPQFVSIYGLKLIVDLIVTGTALAHVMYAVGFLVLLECVHTTYKSFYKLYFLPKSNIRIKKYLNDIIFEKLAKSDIRCYQDREFYDTYTLGVKNSDEIVAEYLDNIEVLISSTLNLAMVIAMVAFIDWWILFVPFVGIAASLIFNFLIATATYKFSNELTKKERFADYIKRMFFSPAHAKEMIVFPIKKLILSRYDSVNDEMKAVTKKYSSKICALDVASNIIFNILGFGLILGLVAYRVMTTGLGLGDFVALANAGLSIVNGFMRVAAVFPELGKCKLFANNVTDLLNYHNTILPPEKPLDLPSDRSIEYKAVTFAYPFASNHVVIKDVSFRIETNQKIAIVGFNGSGKTTLINLLLRLYDPVSGEITMGGNDIRKYDPMALRDCFNIMFQDFQQYPLSIAEFVLMRPAISEDDIALVWHSLERAALKEKVESLPLGIQTKISKEFDEAGENFSGGEIQKLLLARVFSQPQKILILDEPSSSLDAIAENYIFDEILKNIHDKTVIFITHRLSAAKAADKIILMKNGEIIQQGAHKDLMCADGEYKIMYEMQAKKFELDPEEKVSA